MKKREEEEEEEEEKKKKKMRLTRSKAQFQLTSKPNPDVMHTAYGYSVSYFYRHLYNP